MVESFQLSLVTPHFGLGARTVTYFDAEPVVLVRKVGYNTNGVRALVKTNGCPLAPVLLGAGHFRPASLPSGDFALHCILSIPAARPREHSLLAPRGERPPSLLLQDARPAPIMATEVAGMQKSWSSMSLSRRWTSTAYRASPSVGTHAGHAPLPLTVCCRCRRVSRQIEAVLCVGAVSRCVRASMLCVAYPWILASSPLPLSRCYTALLSIS